MLGENIVKAYLLLYATLYSMLVHFSMLILQVYMGI